jgi:hypothetical protein
VARAADASRSQRRSAHFVRGGGGLTALALHGKVVRVALLELGPALLGGALLNARRGGRRQGLVSVVNILSTEHVPETDNAYIYISSTFSLSFVFFFKHNKTIKTKRLNTKALFVHRPATSLLM